MTTPIETQLAIVRRARELFGEFFPGSEERNGCIMMTYCVIVAAGEHEVKLLAFGGSAYWPILADGTRFGYEWEPRALSTWKAIDAGFLPEIHAWAGCPTTGEFVDLTVRAWPEQCKRLHSVDWSAPRPPDFLWATPSNFPEGVAYREDRIGGQLVFSAMRSVLEAMRSIIEGRRL